MSPEEVAGRLVPGLHAASKRRRTLIELIRAEREGSGGFRYLSCDYCPQINHCASAFDLYNTDGDCLEDK